MLGPEQVQRTQQFRRWLRRPTVWAVVLAVASLLPMPTPNSSVMPVLAAKWTYSDKPPYVLGIFPYLTTARLEQIYAPVAADMANAVGRRVMLRTRSSFSAFVKELNEEKYDVVFIQPFDYIEAHEQFGIVPLARRSTPLFAVIMVNSESDIYELAQLKGKVLALPPKMAAVSHLVEATLVQAGFIPGKDITIHYHRSHDACLQQLMIKRADACGTADSPVHIFQERMQVTFRQLARTPSIPHVLFAAHPRVPEADRDAIKNAILSWPDREAGRDILRNGHFNPFTPANDQEYKVVREFWRRISAQQK